MLYCSLCDSSAQYTYFTLPYAGNPEDLNNEASKFYITGTNEYSNFLAENFNRFSSIKSCNISMDRYFTSITLADWETTKHFSIAGTMLLDRKVIPKEIKSMEGREEKSTIYAYQSDGFQSDGNSLLVSYVDKKKAGKKNIVVLTTMHTSVSVTKDQRVKPNVHTFYGHTKGGVDVVDLVSAHNTTKMKNLRWPINVLAFVLDTVRTYAKTILVESSNPATPSSFEFTYTLGKLLVLPHMQRGYQDSSNFSTVFVHKMHQVLGIQVDKPRNVPSANTGRCCLCGKYYWY